jgi:hypothetical protein
MAGLPYASPRAMPRPQAQGSVDEPERRELRRSALAVGREFG